MLDTTHNSCMVSNGVASEANDPNSAQDSPQASDTAGSGILCPKTSHAQRGELDTSIECPDHTATA